jgi:hypothetical protein
MLIKNNNFLIQLLFFPFGFQKSTLLIYIHKYLQCHYTHNIFIIYISMYLKINNFFQY